MDIFNKKSFHHFFQIIFLIIGIWIVKAEKLHADDRTNDSAAGSSDDSSIDKKISALVQQFNLKPLAPLPPSSPAVYRLGKELFFEKSLSGNRNISCATCHHPWQFSGDALSLPIGEGGAGLGGRRVQEKGHIILRHSPVLINLAYPEIKTLFWDGRVSFQPETGIYQTPEEALNGKDPKRKDIVQALNGALSAQALFPLANNEEMRGQKGTNELADSANNLEVWEKIMIRLRGLNGAGGNEKFKKLFQEAYPEITQLKDLNIGHVGKAIATFVGEEFQSHQTPYDHYLNGNTNALTLKQKKGMVIFIEKAQCLNCHGGAHLSDFTFKNLAVPHIAPVKGTSPYPDDLGRYALTQEVKEMYSFKTPGLRNVALTAPYMHNGVFTTLREVIDHYDNSWESLSHFRLKEQQLAPYEDSIVLDEDVERNKLRHARIQNRFVKIGLKLTEEEKEDLQDFLEEALTDQTFQQRMKNFQIHGD